LYSLTILLCEIKF